MISGIIIFALEKKESPRIQIEKSESPLVMYTHTMKNALSLAKEQT